MRFLFRCAIFLLVVSACAATRPSLPRVSEAAPASPVENAFQKGWMLVDTNGDGIGNFLKGYVVVPARPSAAENAAAANLAARLAYGTTGLTLPVVETAERGSPTSAGPTIYVGKTALPSSAGAQMARLFSLLGTGEGGVFLTG